MSSARNNTFLRGFPFWVIVCLLVLMKFILTSDLAVQMIYSPHDDGLYVMRAFHLLWGEAMGPYDARVLVKLPGLSLWLAANRLLGIPYLMSINLFYTVAGIYFISALRRCNFNDVLVIGIFALYLFNPVTLDNQWYRVLREPVAISLLVAILGAMLFCLISLREQKIPLIHIFVLSVLFAFALMVREEDRLLYGLLLPFFAVVIWDAYRNGGFRKPVFRAAILLVIALPLIGANVAGLAVKSFIAKHYGLPIMHDFGEGEFPRLIAAMRSVESRKDNRHVMITQEALGKLRQAVPILAPVIDRLPPPGPDSYSCQRFRVCSEWTNGWMLFWIKDAAFQAGLTPDLPAAQEYFRTARLNIEQACAGGRLQCRVKGAGLLPRFELRWIRAYVHEWTSMAKMMWQPGISLPAGLPLTYPVDVEYGRRYQMVTMSHYYDSQRQVSSHDDAWKNYSKDLYLSLKYWLRYPDVAAAKDFGPHAQGEKLGALRHFQQHGQYEGRVWQEKTTYEDAPSLYKNPADGWRSPIVHFYQKYGVILEFAGLVALILRLLLWRQVPLDAFTWIAVLFAGFTVLRLSALSYVGVYMGGLDVRLFFSTYVVTMLLSPAIVAVAIKSYRVRPRTTGKDTT